MVKGLKFSLLKTFRRYKQPFYEPFIVTLIKLKIIAMERDEEMWKQFCFRITLL